MLWREKEAGDGGFPIVFVLWHGFKCAPWLVTLVLMVLESYSVLGEQGSHKLLNPTLSCTAIVCTPSVLSNRIPQCSEN